MTRRRVGTVAVVIVFLGGVALVLESWWARRELEVARSEIALGQMGPALSRLERLNRLPVAARSSESAFLLGMARWASGRFEPALEAFGRVPAGSEFEPKVAMFQAEAALRGGHLHEAEGQLHHVLALTEDTYVPALEWLEKVYRLQARFDEVRILLHKRLRLAEKPVSVLKELWRLDRGTVPLESIRAGLDEAARRAEGGEEYRIWLGRARLALLADQLAEARSWLDRCLAGPVGPRLGLDPASDPAIWLAWLDWAAAAERPVEVARALDRLGPSQITRPDFWKWRAWLLRRRGDALGEWNALEKVLELDPHQPRILDRLTGLAMGRGNTASARAFREQKAVIDRALLEYDREIKEAQDERGGDASGRTDFLGMARLAEAAGRSLDALAWADLAARQDSSRSDVRSLVQRLRQITQLAVADSSDEFQSIPSWSGLVLEHAESPKSANPAVPGDRPDHHAPIAFADAAERSGLSFTFHNGATPLRQMPEPLSGGVGLLDYDGDGWLDVYVVQGGQFPPQPGFKGDRLFRNRGDGSFEDATARGGIDRLNQGYGHGVTVGDYDNDGDPDLFITRWRSYSLYRNDGGHFVDVTTESGLGGDRDWPTSAAFADLDGDGDLDLYVCHYVRWDAADPKLCRNPRTGRYVSCSPLQVPSMPDHVFRNDRGRFIDVTASAGIVDSAGRGLGVIAAQLDDDMKIDLFVANDMTANEMYRNLGGFRFEASGHSTGVAGNADGGYQAGMGIGFGDVDRDGRMDLAVTNFYGEGVSLYQNLGGGFFTDRSRESGVGQASRYRLGFGIAFLDADNDGWLDLVTANGHLDDLGDVPYRMPMQLFRGEPGGYLRDVTREAGLAINQPRVARGLAIGDLDRDGRLDVIAVDQNAPLVYLHNLTRSVGHWISFRLEGTKSNRDGVGAVVEIVAAGRSQVRQRFGGGSYQSASDGNIHFGIGPSQRLEQVVVRWPSGTVDRWTDLSADTGCVLREGDAAPHRIAGFAP
jgi:tetratricopeptide (TPR) repeat protein